MNKLINKLETLLKIIVLAGVFVSAVMAFVSNGVAHVLPWLLVLSLIAALLLFKSKKNDCDEFLVWSDEYATGLKSIDDDHKKLLNLINNLQSAVLCNTGETFERYNLEELINYTKYHFQREEKLMEQAEYMNYEAHKGQHDQMILKAQSFMRQYDKRGREALSDVAAYLRLWLLQHINHEDKKYVPALKDKGLG